MSKGLQQQTLRGACDSSEASTRYTRKYVDQWLQPQFEWNRIYMRRECSSNCGILNASISVIGQTKCEHFAYSVHIAIVLYHNGLFSFLSKMASGGSLKLPSLTPSKIAMWTFLCRVGFYSIKILTTVNKHTAYKFVHVVFSIATRHDSRLSLARKSLSC